jgi:sugar phosphate isomerase/epimerase
MPDNGVRVGIDLGGSPDPEAIRAKLRRFTDAGFDTVEIDLNFLPLIIGGELKPDYVQWLGALIGEFPLGYSAHVGPGLDLRLGPSRDLHRAVLRASIEACARLRLSPLVLHYELASRDREAEDRFLEAHRWAAGLAAERGVLLCIENIEVELMDPVIRFVETVGHPNLRMTVDVGHAYLAARYFNFDFLDAIRRAMPLAAHMHLSDNTGDFEELRVTNRPVYDAMDMGFRTAFGRGDIHVPPFWGRIPYDEVFSAVFKAARDYRGVFLCEYNSHRFLPFLEQTQRQVREAILRARQ